MSSLTITPKHNISFSQIETLLCSAFEGGSNYWYQIDGYHKPDNFDNSTEGNVSFMHISFPLNKNGFLLIIVKDGVDEEQKGKEYTLNLAKIEQGLKIMSEKYPRHFNDILDENDDAITADVFLQSCLFGEVFYG